MTELSPAAISVDDALAACIQLQGEIVRARPLAAAALRAAADHIDHDWSAFNCVDALCEIATELEGTND